APGGPFAMEAYTVKKFDADAWHHVLMAYDGSAKFAGVAIYVNGQLAPTEPRTNQLTGDIHTDARLTFGARANGVNFDGWLAEPRVYARALTAEEARREFEKSPRPDAASPGAPTGPTAISSATPPAAPAASSEYVSEDGKVALKF